MQQARIARVQGNQIFAGGRWLTAIGNKTMRPGDIVWIDGRCAYGNQSEGNIAPVIVPDGGGIPVFWQNGHHQLYSSSKLVNGILGTPHHRMVNRGGRVVFNDDLDCLDISIGPDRKTYILQNGSYEQTDPDDGKIPGETYEGQAGVSCDGQVIMPLDMKDYMEAGQSYALDQIGKLDTPLPYGPETPGYGERTIISMTRCELNGGWFESAKNYCLFISDYVIIHYMEGLNWHDGGGGPGWEEADVGYCIDLDCYLDLMQTPAGLTILKGNYYRDQDTSPTHYSDVVVETNIPLPDGYSITMTRRNKGQQEHDSVDAEGYAYTLYAANGQGICSLPQYYPGKFVAACKLPGQSWLVRIGKELYRCGKGQMQPIGGYGLGNCRLRPMRNNRNWMKGDS